MLKIDFGANFANSVNRTSFVVIVSQFQIRDKCNKLAIGKNKMSDRDIIRFRARHVLSCVY